MIEKSSEEKVTKLKKFARHSEATTKPKKTKIKPQVRRNEDTFHRSEAILRRNEGSIDQKTTLEFATMEKPSLRQRTASWTRKI